MTEQVSRLLSECIRLPSRLTVTGCVSWSQMGSYPPLLLQPEGVPEPVAPCWTMTGTPVISRVGGLREGKDQRIMVDVLWQSEEKQGSGDQPWSPAPLEVFSEAPFFLLAFLAEASNSLVSQTEPGLPKVGLCHELDIHTYHRRQGLPEKKQQTIRAQLGSLSTPFRFPPTTCDDFCISVIMQLEDITDKHRKQAHTNAWERAIWSAEEEFEAWYRDNWILREGGKGQVVIQNTPNAAFLKRADPLVRDGWQWRGPYWSLPDIDNDDDQTPKNGVRPRVCTLRQLTALADKAAAKAKKAADKADAEAAKAAAEADQAAARDAKQAAKNKKGKNATHDQAKKVVKDASDQKGSLRKKSKIVLEEGSSSKGCK